MTMEEETTPNTVRFDIDNGDGSRIEPPLPHGGHCLFTAGAPSAGKSTLQHAIIHRLHKDAGMDLTFRNEDGVAYQDSDLQEWIFRFDRGEFPPRTPRGTLQTFFIEFGQGRRPVNLSFVEISGESFEDILPRGDEPGQAPQLNPSLEHILTTRSVKKLFLFVADTTRHRAEGGMAASGDDPRDQDLYEDMLFSSLLNRIRALGLNRIKLLFAAAKWDEAPNRNLDPERFFRAHFPQTIAALRRFPKAQPQYIRFTIGNVQTEEHENNGSARTRIAKRDLQPVERVIQWIYSHATGRELNGYPRVRPTLWDRIKRLAAS